MLQNYGKKIKVTYSNEYLPRLKQNFNVFEISDRIKKNIEKEKGLYMSPEFNMQTTYELESS